MYLYSQSLIRVGRFGEGVGEMVKRNWPVVPAEVKDLGNSEVLMPRLLQDRGF